MSRIKFVTDSAADIPAQLRQELEIQVLPFPIAAGDREYRDGVDMPPQEFYKLLLSLPQIPTHAQLTGYVFQQCFEQSLAEARARIPACFESIEDGLPYGGIEYGEFGCW